MSGKSVFVTIVGRVQGVSYRAWTKREAEARGVTGHVRNRDDGAVEAAFAGAAAAVDAMVEACRTGPAAARVEGVTVVPCPAPEGAGFRILR